MKNLHLYFLLLICSSFLFVSCSSKKEPKPTEIQTSTGQYMDTPQDELFSESKRLYQSGMYAIAKDTLESLRDGYPVGPYTEFAEIKIADTFFEVEEFENAALHYEEFLSNHPLSSLTPYVLMQAARSQELSYRGTGRDATPLEESLKFYNQLIQKYPNSPYSEPATRQRKQIVKKIEGHEKAIVEFYKNRGKKEAAMSRQKELDEKLLALNAYLESTTPTFNPPVMKSNLDIETNTLLSPTIKTAALLENAELENDEIQLLKESAVSSYTNRINSVECLGFSPLQILVNLQAPVSSTDNIKIQLEYLDSSEQLAIYIPEASSKERMVKCSNNIDVAILNEGKLMINRPKLLSAMQLQNPPRILLYE